MAISMPLNAGYLSQCVAGDGLISLLPLDPIFTPDCDWSGGILCTSGHSGC